MGTKSWLKREVELATISSSSANAIATSPRSRAITVGATILPPPKYRGPLPKLEVDGIDDSQFGASDLTRVSGSKSFKSASISPRGFATSIMVGDEQVQISHASPKNRDVPCCLTQLYSHVRLL
eukprot:TRINITY_DN6241_c0_g1_i1.p1 TRINITY_DN6241_c0_g1~~TRINITY_DN6241_c0_g1_i1.p1  ORF type:complete len:124 (-),score=18.74 TRINITY_DN6241_c0_g1_i1:1-372(-)